MTRLSSNWTIFYKFFIPTFWIVFGGACVLAAWAMKVRVIEGMSSDRFALLLTISYAVGIAVLYWSTMRLKRVEVDEHYVYVTNYFKNYRYPHQDVAYIKEGKLPIFNRATLRLKASGTLGDRFTYLPVKGWLQDFLREHPQTQINVVGEPSNA